MTSLRLATYSKYGPVLLRFSLAGIFLWFSINQLRAPEDWTIYLPAFLSSTYPVAIIYANAIFEIIFATVLISGRYTRLAALLLGLHLLGIAISLGYGPTMIRDLGLALATLSIAVSGPDIWCKRQ